MTWWQHIAVDFFTNKYVVITVCLIMFVVVTHILGYHPEVWLADLVGWITGTDPTKYFNLIG